MTIDDQVEVRYSEFDPVKMETVEVWKIGTVLSFDDFNFKLKFSEDDEGEYEIFPMSAFEQGDARLIPVKSFSSMFYE